MLIMHGLTPISYTLYFRLYQYFVLLIECLEISTRLDVTCSEQNMVSEAARKKQRICEYEHRTLFGTRGARASTGL